MQTLLLLLFVLAAASLSTANVRHYHQIEPEPKSCLDYRRAGRTENGFYRVLDVATGNRYTVYCDFKTEPGMAWTLVMSFRRKYRNLPPNNQIYSKALTQNFPVNEHSPNLFLYRLSHSRMKMLKAQSTHWRATCNFPKLGKFPKGKWDGTERDYVRARLRDFDVMTFNGNGVCKHVEFIDIRGHTAAETTVPFWQIKNVFMLHTDSTHTHCGYKTARTGAVSTEDNFGHYYSFNPKFSCTATSASTTQHWFGSAF